MHISLYNSLFYLWNKTGFTSVLSINRNDMMRLSKIGSANTYTKCIRTLSDKGYFKYMPSKNPLLGSLVNMYRFDNSNMYESDNSTDNSSDNSTDNSRATLYKPSKLIKQMKPINILIEQIKNQGVDLSDLTEENINILKQLISGKSSKKSSTESKSDEPIIEISRAREVFAEARSVYKGKKKTLDTEFANFKKKHYDWEIELPKLKKAIIKYNNSQQEVKFLQHFQTFINQRSWEMYLDEEPETTPGGKMLPIFPEHLNKKMFKESEDGRKYYDEKTAWFDKFITSNCPEFTEEERDKVWKGIIESHLHLLPTNENVIKFLNQTIDRTIYITDYFK